MRLASQIDKKTAYAMNLFVGEVLNKYKPEDVVLFGSRAKGLSRYDSDIDIAIVLEKSSQTHEDVKLDLESIAFDVLIETGMFIDPLPLWLKEWNNPESFSNPELIKNIRRDGVYL